MGRLLEGEKRVQTNWKKQTTDLTQSAKADGIFKRRTLSYFLGEGTTDENLFADIRQTALTYFKDHGIPWHDNNGDLPSAHLCDSQVCCVNFLMPLNQSEELILALFKRYFPTIQKVLSMDDDSKIAFEWIGEQNYLKEKVRGERTRGANCTSVDAAVMFETSDGKKIIVLIEWKYTESYTDKFYKIAASGTDRTTIYQHLWDREDCPIDKTKVDLFEDLFYEPFYQFTRQQFLANEMEKAKELGADEVYLMHLSPAANMDFKRITSTNLRHLGNSATQVWKSLLVDESRFIPISTEEFFDGEIISGYQEMEGYWKYLGERYGSILIQ